MNELWRETFVYRSLAGNLSSAVLRWHETPPLRIVAKWRAFRRLESARRALTAFEASMRAQDGKVQAIPVTGERIEQELGELRRHDKPLAERMRALAFGGFREYMDAVNRQKGGEK